MKIPLIRIIELFLFFEQITKLSRYVIIFANDVLYQSFIYIYLRMILTIR